MTCYKSTRIQQCGTGKRDMDERSRIRAQKETRTDGGTCFWQRCKGTQWRRKSLQQTGQEHLEVRTQMTWTKTQASLIAYKQRSPWNIKDRNKKEKYKNSRRKHTGESVEPWVWCFRYNTKERPMKKSDKWSSLKKNFCSVEVIVKRMKRHVTDWENIFANHISNIELVHGIYTRL